MDSQTIVNSIDQDEQRGRILKIGLLGVAFAVICILFITAFVLFQPDQLSLSERYFPPPTAIPTGTPKPTATPNVAATQRIIQSTASAQAIESTIASAGSQWPILFSDTFDNNDNHWRVDTVDDEYAKITFEIKDGKYRWNAMTHKEFIQWVPLATISLDDFFLTLEVSVGEHTGSSDYGIVFRNDTNGNFYYFAIDSDQMYSLFRYYAGGWSALIDRTSSSVIRKDQPNRLTVIAEGDHFILFINDQFIADKHDDWIKEGTAALTIEIFQPDQEGTFEFDNIELRVP